MSKEKINRVSYCKQRWNSPLAAELANHKSTETTRNKNNDENKTE